MCAKKFLSTPSARRATIISSIIVLPLSISIHALREEGDILLLYQIILADDFYPRPPRGGRPYSHKHGEQHKDFYPRPPRGGRRRPAWTCSAGG